MYDIATAFLMRDVAKTKFSLGQVTVCLRWVRVLQCYNSLESSQYGVLPTKTPMMHSDEQAL